METERIKGWDNKLRPVERGYPPRMVQRYCVEAMYWQGFRLELKGKPTHEKLQRLEYWFDGLYAHSRNYTPQVREIQVGNYLGALRRGGQLDMDNQIRKYI